jgi:hypothetical protein
LQSGELLEGPVIGAGEGGLIAEQQVEAVAVVGELLE